MYVLKISIKNNMQSSALHAKASMDYMPILCPGNLVHVYWLQWPGNHRLTKSAPLKELALTCLPKWGVSTLSAFTHERVPMLALAQCIVSCFPQQQ